MIEKALILVGLVLSVSLVSCNSGDGQADEVRDIPTQKSQQPGDTEPAGGVQVVRGHYVFGHEVRALRPCGDDEALWVVDRTKLLKDLHEQLAPGSSDYAEIFVVVAGRVGGPPGDGFGADYHGALTVEDVIYAAFEGFGCDFDWNRFIYRAQGNEPFWTMEVLSSEMRLIRPGHADLAWPEVHEKRAYDAVIFHGAGGDHNPVELVIEPGPGRDSMSGAYYGLSARLVLGDHNFTGNAVRGSGEDRESIR